MERIANTFANSKKVLISYIVAGDPDCDTTVDLMHALANNGTDIIELGIPFSDPMADGATIQRATQRAIDKHVGLKDVLNIVSIFRQKNTHTPIVLMGYLNPIFHLGYEEFASLAQKAGVDGVLTVDYTADNIDEFSGCLKQHNISTIFLIAPTTSETRIKMIAQKAEKSQGFIYCVSLKGVTGAASLDVENVANRLAVIRKYTKLPLAVGFGVKTAQDAQQVASCADAVVVGSSFVQAIEDNANDVANAVAKLSNHLKTAIMSL